MNREMLLTDKQKDNNEDPIRRQIWRPKIAVVRMLDDKFGHIDKNGKKILDGDILQVGVVGISDGNCKYVEGWDSTEWEVIGHVYDNKELLGND